MYFKKAGEKMSKKIKYFFLSLIVLTVLMSNLIVYATPNITAPHAVLMDYTTGEILLEHNAHQAAYPASTTKVMTALLVLENADLDDVVTIKEDLYIDGSSMYLLKGESFTVKELLQGLLIRSANDAAEVLAVHISGSIEEFVDLMNKRAKELGALNTHFNNPHGLPDDNHITTAYDLAVIAKHAMSFDLFRDIVATERLDFPPTEFTPESRYYRNTNRFLWGTGSANQILYNNAYTNIKYDIIDGIKTGYTGVAGQCLITSAVKDDQRLISVVLGAEGSNIYLDSRSLIDYGYDNYQLVEIIGKNKFLINSSIANAVEDSISLYTDEPINTVLKKDIDPSTIHRETIVEENIRAPISSGQVLGKVIYSIDDKVLGESNLIAMNSIDAKPFIQKMIMPSNIILPILIIFCLWQVFVIFKRLSKKRRVKSFYVGTNKFAYNYKLNKSLYKRK